MALGVLCATTTSAKSMQPLRVVSWGNLQEVYVHTSRACFEYARVEVLYYTQHLPYSCMDLLSLSLRLSANFKQCTCTLRSIIIYSLHAWA